MFTDVVGFSTHVGEREDRALSAMQRDFALMFELIEHSGGKVLKTLGDGLLAHFGSAVNAVDCAQEIQIRLTQASAGRTDELNLLHRIGIHLGDVFLTEGDVHGNGVNIAARLQTQATPGGICISQTVFDVVKNKLALQVNFLGTQELHHIRESIPMYLVAPTRGPGSRPPGRVDTATAGKPPQATSKIGLDFSFGLHRAPTPPPRRTRLCHPILLVGDYSGRASRGVAEPLHRRPLLRFDVDTFETLFARLQVQLQLPTYRRRGEFTGILIESMESLHPDSLLKSAAPLASLWSTRQALRSPATASEALARVASRLTDGASDSVADDLARLIGKSPLESDAPTAAARTPADVIRNLARATSAGVPLSSPATQAALQAVEMELTDHLRAILHHPEWQRIEAAWRSVDRLARDFGDDENVQLLLLDATRTELLEGQETLAAMLHEHACTLVVVDEVIGANLEDLALVAELGRAAAAVDARVAVGAKPELAGCSSFVHSPDPATWNLVPPAEFATAWATFLTSPLAAHVMLAAPRWLVRQPYGRRSDTIESFAFEEMSAAQPHENYLWGNPAMACAMIWARAAREERDPRREAIAGEFGDLPLHAFEQDGEKMMKPCAEVWLSESAVRAMRASGLITLQSVRNSDAVRISPLTALA